MAVSEQSIIEAAEMSDMANNIPLMNSAMRLAHSAIAHPNKQFCPSSNVDQQAARWLESVELAESNCLLPHAVTAVTTIGEPMAVSNEATTFGARQKLLDTGWLLAKSGRDASVQAKRLNPIQRLAYYLLVNQHHDKVLYQEEAGFFSHSQTVHYYEVLKLAFQHSDDNMDPRSVA